MKKTELFEYAVERYRNLTAFLTASAEGIQAFSPSFSSERLLKYFDMILQCMLIKVGFADYRLTGYELQFIQKITEHHDLLEDAEILIYDDKQAVAREFFEQKADKILARADDILEPIAVLDVYTKADFDFFEFLISGVSQILIAVSAIDGDVDGEELDAAKDLVRRHIALPYAMKKEAVMRELAQNKAN
jgi:hypothetical protein